MTLNVNCPREGFRYKAFKLLIALLLLCENFLSCESQAFTFDVQWITAVTLHEYKGYQSVSLLSVNIPARTLSVALDFRSSSSSNTCPQKNVFVYLQHGGYPLVSPYNETFPDKFHLKRSSLHHVILVTNNLSNPFILDNPQPGAWFISTFLPKSEKKYSQKGLSGPKCGYGLGVRVRSQIQEDILAVDIGVSYLVDLRGFSSSRTFKFFTPDGTWKYKVIVSNCYITEGNLTANISKCPVYLSVSSLSLPPIRPSLNCENITSPCSYSVTSPAVNQWNYIRFSFLVANIDSLGFDFQIQVSRCLISEISIKKKDEDGNPTMNTSPNYNNSKIVIHTKRSVESPPKCVVIPGLGRYQIAREDFTSAFLFSDVFFIPQDQNKIFIPDNSVLTTFVDLSSEIDNGGTLQISVKNVDYILEATQDAVVWLCLLKHAIPTQDTVKTCSDGVSLSINTSSARTSASTVYIPYPEEGRYYVSLLSMCFLKSNGSVQQWCKHYPMVTFTVQMAKCVNNKCGTYGACQEYISGIMVFSSCKCNSGWRGYGCTDGTEAESKSTMLMTTLLLTLSNLFFIPSICLAVYRRYFVEALVYLYTMFFSTFYHACDSNEALYFYCLMKYDVLSFCDFLGSIMSFWVTIIAMAKPTDRLRSFLHMMGLLGVAVGVEYDRHGLWVFLVPAVLGVIIMMISWILRCKRRRKLYPSLRRYLLFLLPGVLLAATGLIIFAFLETDENYRYTHSTWHVVMATCIIFLLPSRSKSVKDENEGLDIQTDSVYTIMNDE